MIIEPVTKQGSVIICSYMGPALFWTKYGKQIISAGETKAEVGQRFPFMAWYEDSTPGLRPQEKNESAKSRL